MLINTVVLFLKDILPVFLALNLILSYRHVATNTVHTQFHQALAMLMILGLAMSTLIITLVPGLSGYLDGSGVELFNALGYITIYSLIIGGLYWMNYRMLLLSLAVLTMFHGADFLVYLYGFWSEQALTELIVATMLGGGICISIAILMYFLCETISRWWHLNSAEFILIAFATGHLVKVTQLLMQADFLSNHQTLYNSNSFINESSEIGYFLVALIGYDATPTLLQIVLYGIGFFVPLWLILAHKIPKTPVLKASS